MDVFSLEEDDGNYLFITQEPSNKGNIDGNVVNYEENLENVMQGEANDGQKYSGISDDDFEMPCSQRTPVQN